MKAGHQPQTSGDLKHKFSSTNDDLKGQIRNLVRTLTETLTVHMIQPLLTFTSTLNEVSPSTAQQSSPELIQWMNFVREEDEINRKNYIVLTNDLAAIISRLLPDTKQKNEFMNRLEYSRQGMLTQPYQIPELLKQVSWILKPEPDIISPQKVEPNPFLDFGQDDTVRRTELESTQKSQFFKTQNDSSYFIVPGSNQKPTPGKDFSPQETP